MKTMIDLPEEVLQRAKIVAAQRRTTLKDLVIQGLDLAMNESSVVPGERAKRLLVALGKARNSEPVPSLNRAALYDREVLPGH